MGAGHPDVPLATQQYVDHGVKIFVMRVSLLTVLSLNVWTTELRSLL